MKKQCKILVAVVIYIILIIIGYWTVASSTDDKWDDLMKWVKK